jgi:hypothetical protein
VTSSANRGSIRAARLVGPSFDGAKIMSDTPSHLIDRIPLVSHALPPGGSLQQYKDHPVYRDPHGWESISQGDVVVVPDGCSATWIVTRTTALSPWRFQLAPLHWSWTALLLWVQLARAEVEHLPGLPWTFFDRLPFPSPADYATSAVVLLEWFGLDQHPDCPAPPHISDEEAITCQDAIGYLTRLLEWLESVRAPQETTRTVPQPPWREEEFDKENVQPLPRELVKEMWACQRRRITDVWPGVRAAAGAPPVPADEPAMGLKDALAKVNDFLKAYKWRLRKQGDWLVLNECD